MYYKGKELNLKEFLAVKKTECTPKMWEEEAEIWAIQEYESSMGEFSEEDEKYLNELGFSVEDFTEE